MNAPDALLLIAPGCPHCPGVLDALARLVKEGVIGQLQVVNVAVHPEQAQALKVRGVPWVKLGPFALDGARSAQELREWAGRAGDPQGLVDYLEQLLVEGGLARAEAVLAEAPGQLPALLQRTGDPALPMQVRLGIGALVEGLADSPALAAALPVLTALAASPDARVRADACHFLGFTGSAAARAPLEACLVDASADVREIAQESLERLK